MNNPLEDSYGFIYVIFLSTVLKNEKVHSQKIP